jgi:hypothetical protein
MNVIELIPGEDIRLFSFDDHWNIARFVANFQRTWDRIPKMCRARILEHWHPTCKSVEVVSALSEMPGRLATTRSGGRCLEFLISVVDAMPDHVVCELIAHELAHVSFYAKGNEHHSKEDEASKRRREELVERRVREWGFHPELLTEWVARYGEGFD